MLAIWLSAHKKRQSKNPSTSTVVGSTVIVLLLLRPSSEQDRRGRREATAVGEEADDVDVDVDDISKGAAAIWMGRRP
jgi:hypothetical protein